MRYFLETFYDKRKKLLIFFLLFFIKNCINFFLNDSLTNELNAPINKSETQNFCIKRSNGTTEHKHKSVKKYIIG